MNSTAKQPQLGWPRLGAANSVVASAAAWQFDSGATGGFLWEVSRAFLGLCNDGMKMYSLN